MTMIMNRKAILDHRSVLTNCYVEGEEIPVLEWHKKFVEEPIELSRKETSHVRLFQMTIKTEKTKLRAALSGVKRKNSEEASAIVGRALEEETTNFCKSIKTDFSWRCA